MISRLVRRWRRWRRRRLIRRFSGDRRRQQPKSRPWDVERARRYTQAQPPYQIPNAPAPDTYRQDSDQ